MEIWKDIKGYEGLYLISNKGRILSLYRKRGNGNGGYYQETKELKQSKTSTGYWKIELYKNKQKKSIKTHRLVAIHFVANPYNKPNVNHIDGNPLNNDYKNLEWVTQQENVIHAIENGLKDVFNIDKRTFKHLYIEKNMSLTEMSDLFNIALNSVSDLAKKYGLFKSVQTTYQIEEEWLKEELTKGRSNKDIAEELGCDASLISVYKNRIKRGEKIYGN